jgi:hypothetical protein
VQSTLNESGKIADRAEKKPAKRKGGAGFHGQESFVIQQILSRFSALVLGQHLWIRAQFERLLLVTKPFSNTKGIVFEYCKIVPRESPETIVRK